MKQLNRIIVENATSGKIDRQVAARMLKMIHDDGNIRHEDIAIIGMSVNLPGAKNLDEFWNLLKEGRSAFGRFPEGRKRDIDRYLRYTGVPDEKLNYSTMAYLDEIDKFDAEFFRLPPKEAGLMDPNQRLFLQEAWKAVEDAGYGGKRLMGSRTGVFIGFRADDYYDYKNLIMDAEPSSTARALTGNLTSVIAGRLSYLLDLKGPSLCVDTSCSSSLVAVHMACLSIQAGESDMAVAGGVRVNLVPLDTGERIGMESSSAEIRVFDESSDGTVLGEGVIAILLKPLSKAQKDRDPIYAVIKGGAVNQDGSSIGLTAPNAAAQEEVLAKAWKAAGIDPETIACIETHGTGTKLGDPIEAEGIQRAFRRFTGKKQFCAIGSVKTNIGHLDNAAGIAGLAKAVLMLKNRMLLPTPRFHFPNRKILFEESPVYVCRFPAEWDGEDPMRCGVSSFGFSGTNCHILLEEAPRGPAAAEAGKEAEIFTVSAKSEYSLIRILEEYRRFLNQKEAPALDALCRTANTGRGHYGRRLAILAADGRDLGDKIGQVLEKGLENDDDIFYQDCGKEPEAGLREKTRLAEQKARELAAGSFSRELAGEICKLYVQGADVPWDVLYENRGTARANIPSYVFQKQRNWIEIPEPSPTSRLFYRKGWMPEMVEKNGFEPREGALLLFRNREAICDELAEKLRVQGREVIEISLARAYRKINDRQYEIDGCQDSYIRLLQDIHGKIGQIVHLFAYANHRPSCSFEDRLEQGVYSLFRLVKALNGRDDKTEILLVTHSISRMGESAGETVPENALPVGLAKNIRNEYSGIACRTVEADESLTAGELLEELVGGPSSFHAAYRNHVRYVERIEPAGAKEPGPVSIRENGIYLITGGLGGIGLEIAKYLASRKKVRLVLTGRQPIPEKPLWADAVRTGTDPELRRKLEILMEIEQGGSEVTCFSGDVADSSDMERLLREIRKKGGVSGIIHCAGIPGGGYLAKQSPEEFDAVLKPKVHGARILDRLTDGEEMDFLILMSSVASLTGDSGRGGYTAANAYLEAYARHRSGKGRKTIVISWPVWENTGMAKLLDPSAADGIFKAIRADDAVKAFGEVLRTGWESVIVGELNRNLPDAGSLEKLGIRMDGELSDLVARMAARRHTETAGDGLRTLRDVKLAGRKDGQYSETERLLAGIWCEVLGFQELDVNDNFFETGGDSVLLTRVQSLLEKVLPGKTAITDLFAYPSILKLAAFIDEQEGKDGRPEAAMRSRSERQDIAIIGMAARMPDAEDLRQYWENLLAGRDSVREYPAARQKDCGPLLRFSGVQKGDEAFYKGGFLEEVDQFDYRFFKISPKEASLLDPSQRLFLEVAYEAVEDAGYGGGLSGSRTGVFAGYGSWPFYGLQIAVDEPESRGVSTPGNTASFVAGRVAHILDLHGPSLVVDTACSSSLVSVHLACESIRSGGCDLAIAGGVKINLLPIMSAAKIGVESSDYTTRTFDDRANGTVWGEGAGAILLKPCKDAVWDGDQIYAVIKGTAVNQDGNSISITAPNVLAQEDVIVRAWEDAGVRPETIRYIEVHGTGTKLGDPIEIDGIKRAFSRFTKKKQFCAVTSVKPNIGHLDSAAGISSLIKAVMVVKHRLIPPMIHLGKPNSRIDFLDSPVYIGSGPEKIEREDCPIRCGVSSFGLSGTNCHIILEEAPVEPDAGASPEIGAAQENIPCLLTLSAKSEKALEAYLKRFMAFLDGENEMDLESVCYTSNTGREHFQYRVAVLARNLRELRERIRERIDGKENHRGGFAGPGPAAEAAGTPETLGTPGELVGNTLRGLEEEPFNESLLERLAQLYVNGETIDWKRLYPGRNRKKASIPTYPFDRSRCWLNPPEPAAADREPAVKASGPDRTAGLIRELRQTLDKWESGPHDAEAPVYDAEIPIKDTTAGDRTPPEKPGAGRIVLKGAGEGEGSGLERAIARIWGKALGCTEIGIDEDFFEIGGHSILAAGIEAEMKAGGMFAGSEDIYQYPTVRKMAAYLEEGGKYIRESSRVLEGIEPFNDVFFKNCFYNSFFPVITYFKKSILPVLVNEIALYDDRKDREVRLGSRYVSVRPVDEVMKHMGIGAVRKEECENIEEDIICAVASGHPVVLWVDCFYESIREDTYRKLHWPHTLLVYGFDAVQRVFHVMEHKNRESLTYEKTVLPFEDVIRAYEGYLEQFHRDENDRDAYTYYEFHDEGSGGQADFPDGDYAALCVENLKLKAQEVKGSASCLPLFEENFMRIALEEDRIKQYADELLEAMNGIINGKLMEKYKFTLLFGQEHPFSRAAAGIVDAWNNIRAVLTKYMFTGVLRRNSIQNKSAQFRQIAALESELTDRLAAREER